MGEALVFRHKRASDVAARRVGDDVAHLKCVTEQYTHILVRAQSLSCFLASAIAHFLGPSVPREGGFHREENCFSIAGDLGDL